MVMSHGFQHNGTPGSLSGEEDTVAGAFREPAFVPVCQTLHDFSNSVFLYHGGQSRVFLVLITDYSSQGW